jgi:translation elongation factor P/translation initiation factor 5A
MAYPSNKKLKSFNFSTIREGDVIVLKNGATCTVRAVSAYLDANIRSGSVVRINGEPCSKTEYMTWEKDGTKRYKDTWGEGTHHDIVGIL